MEYVEYQVIENLLTLEELCPSCGEFRILIERTGFCRECTRPSPSTLNKQEQWFVRNASTLDRLLALGVPVDSGKEIIAHINTAQICIVCHEHFKRGSRGRSLFCGKHQKCKTAKRRLRWLIEEKRMTHKEAIRYMGLIHREKNG